MNTPTIHKHFLKLHRPSVGDLAAGAGMLGALFVGLEDAYTANLLWAAANPVMIRHHYKNRDYNFMVMFLFYEVCAVFGVLRHWRGVA